MTRRSTPSESFSVVMSPSARALVANKSGSERVAGVGQNHVAGAAHLQREIIVGFDQAAVGHLHGRMVGAQFAEQHVERDGFRALRGQFRCEPAIDFARPVKAEMKADASILHGGDAGFSMETKARLVAAGAGKCRRAARPQVIGHPLQPLEKIQPASRSRKQARGRPGRGEPARA